MTRPSQADPAALAVMAHHVHQNVATSGAGGDATAPFTDATGAPVQWTPFDIAPLWDRLQREASLDTGSVDVGFVLNTQGTRARR